MVDGVERAVLHEAADEARVADVALDPVGGVSDILAEASGEIVGRDNLHAEVEAGIHYVGADEAPGASHERPHARSSRDRRLASTRARDARCSIVFCPAADSR